MKEEIKMNAGRITINHMSFGYDGSRKIFENFSLKVNPGERVGIVGENGVGKSTLLRLIAGLNIDFSGDILINDIGVSKKTLKDIRKDMGYVFQDADNQLFMSTVYEDVAFAPRNYGMRGSALDACVKQALAKVGIEELFDRPVYHLSGGEKKLASIAGVLAMEPGIIMFDEPGVALDPRNRMNLINILNELSQTILITSHDMDFILDTCDRTILLYKGSIIKDGKSKDILFDKKVLEDCGLMLPLSAKYKKIT